ncbi:MAG: cation/H(+) antiporter, partial [Marivirga sp.]|nr:cation/H(+) antiporter [Marivirga sp.]
GPSFVGMYFPEFSAFIFPAQSLPNLQFLSQIGLILFMFIVGMELDLKVLKNKGHEAVVVSHASIVFPFALGVLLAFYIYTEFAPTNVPFHSFGLFFGIAMSITAFPVLARIVQERGLSKTKLGALVITCAAADDITAWCILAAVIAIVKAGTFTSALFTIAISIGYVIVMIKVVQPFLKKIGDIYSNREGLSKPIVAIFLATLILSSYTTEILGIHALFGAFMAGVMMPPNMNFRSLLIEKVEDVAVVLLLPLFFVFTGLRTEINLMDNIAIWGVCGLIILVAVMGKFMGSALAARFVGQSWHESLSIGALMNTRGLMELVVLNIGYDLGILTPEVFAMMVIMALVTTFMTGPALNLINRLLPQQTSYAKPDELDNAGKYRILISFGDPGRGSKMLMLAASFINRTPSNASITALHFSPSNELNQYNVSEYERDSFEPIKREAQRLNVPLITLFKPSPDIEKDMVMAANVGNFDLMIIGIGQSVFEGTLLGKVLGFTTRMINPGHLYGTLTGREKMFNNTFDERTRNILRSSKIPVGIFIDKDLRQAKEIIIPLLTDEDS